MAKNRTYRMKMKQEKEELSQVVWIEGTDVRSLKCAIKDETEDELVVDTLQKRLRIKKKWIVKIETDLPGNEDEDEQKSQRRAAGRNIQLKHE